MHLLYPPSLRRHLRGRMRIRPLFGVAVLITVSLGTGIGSTASAQLKAARNTAAWKGSGVSGAPSVFIGAVQVSQQSGSIEMISSSTGQVVRILVPNVNISLVGNGMAETPTGSTLFFDQSSSDGAAELFQTSTKGGTPTAVADGINPAVNPGRGYLAYSAPSGRSVDLQDLRTGVVSVINLSSLLPENELIRTGHAIAWLGNGTLGVLVSSETPPTLISKLIVLHLSFAGGPSILKTETIGNKDALWSYVGGTSDPDTAILQSLGPGSSNQIDRLQLLRNGSHTTRIVARNVPGGVLSSDPSGGYLILQGVHKTLLAELTSRTLRIDRTFRPSVIDAAWI
jgi:hypothetical protein